MTPSTGVKRALALTMLPVAFLAATAQSATAQPKIDAVKCGTTLTQDTTLTKNLTCSGPGLILAPGVDLDLGGHTLSGSSSVAGAAVSIVVDVNDLGPDRVAPAVKISNGTIRNFQRSIEHRDPNGEDFTQPYEVDRLKVINSSLRSAFGNLTVTNSTFTNVEIVAWASTFSATDTKFDRSKLTGEMTTMTINRSQLLATLIGDENMFVTIENSLLDGSGSTLAPVRCGTSTTIRSTTVRNFVAPLLGNPCTLVVSDSTFQNLPNGAIDGQWTVSGSTFRNSGVAVQGSGTISDSLFVRNTTGVLVLGDYLGDASATTLTGNTFRDNVQHGVFTEAPGLNLKDNTALRNGDYGIHAPAANDLGGNVARGNGQGNCVGLTCATR